MGAGLAEVIGARVFVDVVVPRTKIAGRMRLVTRREQSEIRAEARQYLTDSGFPVDSSAITSLGAQEEWNAELAVRMLATAVRDPGNSELALASVDDWRECDDDQLGGLFDEYQQLAARVDPLGSGVELSDSEFDQMVEAAKKKEPELLMSYGSRKQALFAITLASQLATSATPMS
ncbi:MAG: hypothetical protein M3619_00620 [Myxococcota bacterium]|nr:hypothetical protein [Myxococcota bacterium]